jgi:hypothetical protein
MTKKKTPIKVVTVEKSCEMLRCSRPTFYVRYRNRLPVVPSGTNRVLFKLDDIKDLVQEEFGEVPDYEIVG